ncbi:MAG: hypothetical protein ABIH90_01605, partial [Candidatus Aenigmatarchaeota archaeon]
NIPHPVYLRGKEATRSFLLQQAAQKQVTFERIRSLLASSSIVITHGFIMRKFFSELFNVEITKLKHDERFIEYLSGFQSGNGGLIDMKIANNKDFLSNTH